MSKYFYLFGGVIIGAFFGYYLKKDDNYSEFDYEDIQHTHNVSEESMTGQSMTEQSMSEQSIPGQIFQCEPQIIKLKSS